MPAAKPSKVDAVVGIDLGGTNTVLGLMDGRGGLLVEHGLATRSHLPVESLFDEIFAWLDGQSVEHRLLGVGIGAPNANHFSGCIEHPPNLIWDRVDLVASVRRHSDLPVAVTNDANAAALGELRFGAARGLRHFV